MKYETSKFTVYLDANHKTFRKFTFFIQVKEGYTFKISKNIEPYKLKSDLRYPKFLTTAKKWPCNLPEEEIRELRFGEYQLTYNNSVIEINE